jgi:hypothetical protein
MATAAIVGVCRQMRAAQSAGALNASVRSESSGAARAPSPWSLVAGEAGPLDLLGAQRREHGGHVVPEPARQLPRALRPAELFQRGGAGAVAAGDVTARAPLGFEQAATFHVVLARRRGRRGQDDGRDAEGHDGAGLSHQRILRSERR